MCCLNLNCSAFVFDVQACFEKDVGQAAEKAKIDSLLPQPHLFKRKHNWGVRSKRHPAPFPKQAPCYCAHIAYEQCEECVSGQVFLFTVQNDVLSLD